VIIDYVELGRLFS